MPNKPLTIASHLLPEVLKSAYLGCKNPIKRTRLHLIWLISKTNGTKNVLQAARIVGRSADWARKTIRRYNQDGFEGLTDKREDNGTQKIIDDRQQGKLKEALLSPPQDKGLWTGPKVSLWLSKELGKKISAVTGWHYLLFLGYSLQTPRPRHRNAATPEEQEVFKKNSK